MSRFFDNEDIEWICEGPCGDTLGRNSNVTRVTTANGEVIKAEDGRVLDMEPQFPVETEYLCFTCYSAKYKNPVKALRTAVGVIANVVELLEAPLGLELESQVEGVVGASGAALNKLNELVVYIAGVLPSLSQKEIYQMEEPASG